MTDGERMPKLWPRGDEPPCPKCGYNRWSLMWEPLGGYMEAKCIGCTYMTYRAPLDAAVDDPWDCGP